MGAARSHLVKAPLGQVILDGQGAIHVTNVNVNKSVTELEALSGCDAFPWHTEAQRIDVTGDFTLQDFNLQIEKLATGGAIIATSAADKIVKEEAITVPATPFVATVAEADITVDEDGFGIVVVEKYDANGSTVMTQVSGAPSAADEFQVSDAAAGDITFHTSNEGDTLRVTYQTEGTSRDNLQVSKSNTPGLVSLLLPICARTLAAPDTDDHVGFYFPRVRITGSQHGAQVGQNTISEFTYNFRALPDGNNLIVQVV